MSAAVPVKPEAPAPVVNVMTMKSVPLTDLAFSKTNPRKHFDKAELEELTENVRAKGVLQPILVRPAKSHKGFEVVAGERRVRAARGAGLEEIPAVVRELSDEEALEIQVIENLQRSDLHPLEEAHGYQQMLATKHYDVARISERTGRSVHYVYDRMKLLSLTREAQKLFLDGRFTAAHAVLVARLKPADQERLVQFDPDGKTGPDGDVGPLWQAQRGIHYEEGGADDGLNAYKPVSVKELQAWVDAHVRFDAAEPDPMLFPETALALKTATEEKEKVVHITHELYVQDDARDGKTYTPRTWKRADGKGDSKPCPRAVTGVVVVGAGRGEAFKVCTNKDHCDVHWGKERRERGKRKKETGAGGGDAQTRWDKEEERRKREIALNHARETRWRKAAPAILKAIAEALKKAPARAGSTLADILVATCKAYDVAEKDVAAYVPRGKSAEDLVRYCAFLVLLQETSEWNAHATFPKRAREVLGLDVAKIVAAAAPEPKCRECGCTEEKACKGGCSWAQAPDPRTGIGVCSKCMPKTPPASGSTQKRLNAQKAAAKPKAKRKAA